MKLNENIDWAKDWKKITFSENLQICGVFRGRSAANIQVKSKDDNKYYTIFLTDFIDMVVAGKIKKSEIKGIFEVKKRGSNFGIRLVDTPKMETIKDLPFKPRYYPVPDWV